MKLVRMEKWGSSLHNLEEEKCKKNDRIYWRCESSLNSTRPPKQCEWKEQGRRVAFGSYRDDKGCTGKGVKFGKSEETRPKRGGSMKGAGGTSFTNPASLKASRVVTEFCYCVCCWSVMEKNHLKRRVKVTQKDCRGIWRSRDVEVCAAINCHMYWKRGVPKFILSMTEWLNPP